jgi:hypothetical protein
MMVIGIHDGRAPREIRENRYAVLGKTEGPGLRIVAVCGQRRIADEVFEFRMFGEPRSRRGDRSGVVRHRAGG